jgi:hypothetical protein
MTAAMLGRVILQSRDGSQQAVRGGWRVDHSFVSISFNFFSVSAYGAFSHPPCSESLRKRESFCGRGT